MDLFIISVFDYDLFSNEIVLSINFHDKGTLLKIVFKANVMLSTHIIGNINDENINFQGTVILISKGWNDEIKDVLECECGLSCQQTCQMRARSYSALLPT